MISNRFRSFALGSLISIVALMPLHAQQRTSASGLPTSRRVWADPTEDERDGGNVSPDGRLFAFSSWPDAGLTVRTLATGETRYLTGSRAPHKTSDASAYTPIFSPDGKFIAYAWDDDTLPGYEVRVIDIEGSSSRQLYRPVGNADPIPTDWSRDGRYIVATEATSDRTVRLLLLPAAGGAPRVLRSFVDWQFPAHARMSPDGKLLAYSMRPSKDAIGLDVYVLPLDGSRASAVVTGPADDQFVGWTPDGRLVFVSDAKGSPALYTMRLGHDNAPSAPELIKKDLWRSEDFDLAANGTLFYSVKSGDRDVFSAAFDVNAGRLTSKPIGLTGHSGEAHSAPDISPDGRLVVYFTSSADLRRQKYARFGTTTLTVQPLEGGQSRTVRPKVAGLTQAVWGLDEKSLFIQARDDRGRPATRRLDLKTGEVSVTNYLSGAPSFSRDGKWLFTLVSARAKLRDRLSRLVAHRLADSAEHIIWQSADSGLGPYGQGASARVPLVSPDGRLLAFALGSFRDSAFSQRIMVTDVVSGSARELVSSAAFPRQFLRPVSFTPDGKFLLLTTSAMTSDSNQRPSRLWRMAITGGAPQQIEMPRNDFDLPALSPDGRRLVFTAGTVAPEYWVLEDSRLGFSGPASKSAGREHR